MCQYYNIGRLEVDILNSVALNCSAPLASSRECRALESIAANFESDLVRAVEVVVAVADTDHKMELLHVGM